MDSCFPQQQDNNVGVTRAIASHKCTPFDFSFKFKENKTNKQKVKRKRGKKRYYSRDA